MYAKIATLLALVFGGFGVATTSQSAIRDHTRFDRQVESVRVTDVNERNEREDGQEDPTSDSILGCHVTDGTLNPEAEALAAELGVPYESVLAWFCVGYSANTVQVVYEMSLLAQVSIDQIYDMRVIQGLTWDQIIQELGITFSRGDLEPALLDEPQPTRPER